MPRAARRLAAHGRVAIKDEDGYFYIVDRTKDMIISGGFNIYRARSRMR